MSIYIFHDFVITKSTVVVAKNSSSDYDMPNLDQTVTYYEKTRPEPSATSTFPELLKFVESRLKLLCQWIIIFAKIKAVVTATSE